MVKNVNNKRLLFLMVLLLLALCLIMTACGDRQKRIAAESAMAAKQQENEAAVLAASEDKTPPEFSCTMEKAVYEVDDYIDYDRLKLSLSAVDDIDGDVTKNIIQGESSVVEHVEGAYEIIFSVSDSAGNKATFHLPVVITSKYESDEKNRLNACVKAYNKLSDVLKAPSTLNLYNINTNSEGSIVVLNYSAQNGFGAYIRGRVAYHPSSDTLIELDSEEVPNDFTLGQYVYDYDDIKEFSDYYHPEP